MKEQREQPHVLSISYAKGLFTKGSREQQRAKKYASQLGSYNVIVFTRKKEGFEKQVLGESFSVHPTNSSNRLFMLLDAYRIGRSILAENRQVQHVVSSQDPFETSFVGVLLARARNALHHVQVHGDVFSNNAWRRESILNRIRLIFGRFVVRRARCVRVVSERIKRSLLALGVAEERVVVLPIYGELETFLDIDRTHHSSERVVILTAGRLAREKHFSLLIDAVHTLVASGHAIELRIVGSGPEAQRLKTRVKELQLETQVTFIPWTPSLTPEMQAADIFALTSDHEGYGLVLVEAMAAGLPVVTTDVGCAGEAVRDRKDGLVVPVGDEQQLVAALRTCIEDEGKRIRFGKSGREHVRTHVAFTAETYLDAWVAAYLRCW